MKHTAADTTIFSVMSALANEHKAINLSQGFPDYPLHPALSEHLFNASKEGFNQYAPMIGWAPLREQIANQYAHQYHVSPNPDTEITITPGATYGIFTALASILSADDEVIVLEPAYDSYVPNIEMCNATPICIALKAPFFSVDWEAIKKAINAKTKAIIVNTPHNPTGAVWAKEDWNTLYDLIKDTAIYVIADEVYDTLLFDGQQHFSAFQHEGLRNRCFCIYSFGKSLHATGWKLGYVIAEHANMQLFRRLHQYLSFSVSTPTQVAVARFLETNTLYAQAAFMQQKRDFFLDALSKTPFKIHQKSPGSYFQVASYDAISDMPDTEFAKWLTINYGVATIPLSPFYKSKKDERLIRFCFAKEEQTIRNAMQRLLQIPSNA
ncbi:MAG: methionine aminotransferase [Bacteroidota bacterium]